MDFEFKANDTQKHTAAHILAAAVKRLYPNVKIGIGPVTKSGFFYDFETDKEITTKSLPLIEKNIEGIIREALQMKQVVYTKADAINLLLQMGQVYKAEMVKTLPDEQVSFYKLGEEFLDPDRGPHLSSTSLLYKIKLTRIEEVHWNNDPSRPLMYRIHGIVFTNETEVHKYEKAKLLQEENSFESIGQSEKLVLKDIPDMLSSRGSTVANALTKYLEESIKEFNPKKLVGVENMEIGAIHKLIETDFNQEIKSYKTLPTLYSAETISQKNVTVNNLVVFSLSDRNSAVSNINGMLENYIDMFNYITSESFSVDIKCANLDAPIVSAVSTLLQNKIVSHDKVLSSSVGDNQIQIDFKVNTDMGIWILATMNIYNDVPTIYKTDSNNASPTINTRTEFKLYNLIEYLYQTKRSNIPFKFQPTQVVCIPQRKEQYDFARSIRKELIKLGYRADIDLRSKSLRGKIRSAERKNTPFILVLGKKEELNRSASIRHNHVEVGLIALDNILEFISSHADK